MNRSAARVRKPERVSPWRAAASSTMAKTRAGTVMLILRALLESCERSTVTRAQSPSRYSGAAWCSSSDFFSGIGFSGHE